MADGSKIEWTDATWQIVTGCSVVSPGCTNCYAMRLAGTRLAQHPSRAGLTKESKAGPVWTGDVHFNEQWLTEPIKWKRPRKVFVCAHGDLFHESVPDEWIDRVFAVMALAPQHRFQVLTKRSGRMREYLTHSAVEDVYALACRKRQELAHEWHWPLRNVWLGVSCEDQRRADERIPDLLATPAAVRWVSAEPLLGPLEIDTYLYELAEEYGDGVNSPGLDWVVCGGESGPNARPMHPDWVRSIRDQCKSACVPFLFKQWGEWVPEVGAVDGWMVDDTPEISRFDHRDWEDDHWGECYRPMWSDERDDDTVSRVGKKRAGRLLDGVLHDEYPEAK
jgi:protein gp37